MPDATSAAASPRSGLDDERYLYLRCGRGTDAMPYGLAGLLHQRNAASITLVGAVLDVHVLRSHRFADACAPRGTTIAKPSFETLAKLGVEDVTLALDNDNAGRAGASRAIDQATAAIHAPCTWVIDPDFLDPPPRTQARSTGSAARPAGAPPAAPRLR